MKKTFLFYSDPGHGWLKTSLEFLKQLGIEREITSYSYYRKGSVFLEEDLDMSTFIETLKEKGIQVKIKENYSNKSSKIRNYEFYNKGIA